jgi:hypothetical protein
MEMRDAKAPSEGGLKLRQYTKQNHRIRPAGDSHQAAARSRNQVPREQVFLQFGE